LIGFMINWALQGVLSMQVYLYYLAFPKDPRHNKLLVYGIFLFESFQSILLVQIAFRAFAAGYGDMAALDSVGLIWFAVPIMGGIIACVTQCFYAYRVSILSQKRAASIIIVFVCTFP
ncbi:hypothetical protein GALMADRAFT_66734, partial [Galerina marginata CBS 339.88]